MKKANRIANVPPYLFAEIDKKREAAKARGIDIINISIGDPDTPTPAHIVDAMHKAIDNPANHDYPPYEGTMAFKEAVAYRYKARFGVDLDPKSEIIALIGSKEGIAHIFLAFVDPGDTVLLPNPGYPVYNVGTILAGGVPHYMPLRPDQNWTPDLSQIPEDVAKKAKLMFLNYPGNPTAAVAPKSFFEEAIAFAKKYDILICHDLAYSDVSFDGVVVPSILEIPGAKDVCIEFNSLSKTYNMTGWRLGMAVGNAEAIAALSIIKTNVDSGQFKAIQEAGIVALRGPHDHLDTLNAMYKERRDILFAGLKKLGWDNPPPKASFYAWLPVPPGYTSASFIETLIEKCGIVATPGNGYGSGGEGWFRLTITTPKEKIIEALDRMEKAGIRYK